MIKSQKDKEIEKLAKKYSKKDKRLSWGTCIKKAKAQYRLFNQ
ncbi:hypothetical protein TUMSATVNIG1_59610 (plasmid) [Vibrio nigripulchritudo]|nr:hypothetical protein [Vibrio nigripulchritudo]BCL73975.1 hypothetical protein VNTUMSATTG_59120 [Vibrio nigripulchritudo]BDU35352.1 hypothetical protein TUMSATVNIG1_59610 [Vibrio nigripulchritudo]